jgi:hypothetical protein
MSLLDALSGAEVLVVDEDQRLAYAWFGGMGVNVYDETGREVHYFTVGTPDGRKPTPKMVRAAIERVRADAEW